MKTIIPFIEFMTESYDYKPIDDPYTSKLKYEFTNKDNVNFYVEFSPTKNGWTREYGIKNKRNSFTMLENPDAINVIRTVTDITVDFIEMFEPETIIIEHIASKKEKGKEGFDPNDENQRLRINRRFLIKYLPKDYEYNNFGPTSIITKK